MMIRAIEGRLLSNTRDTRVLTIGRQNADGQGIVTHDIDYEGVILMTSFVYMIFGSFLLCMMILGLVE